MLIIGLERIHKLVEVKPRFAIPLAAWVNEIIARTWLDFGEFRASFPNAIQVEDGAVEIWLNSIPVVILIAIAYDTGVVLVISANEKQSYKL